MRNKNIYLITGILAFIVFIGFMGETGPKSLLGFSMNIWVFRVAWLAVAISSISQYLKLKKAA